ncbi:MAG TPA: hypothetical protein P5548_00720 [Candidatus Moranbacteria bacterium]|nr:hypothetical protein [Candidatus Moranbacteria bacterium]HRZ33415.1 hypothetical protein [Candidatus Moranbacteria bacterium]
MQRRSRKTVFGGIYIGIKGGGDANTNEILYKALVDANLSTEHERKEYKGTPINVWKVTSSFVKMLYKKQHNFNLLFVAYEEINYTLQIFKFLDPIVRKKAKQMKLAKECEKKKREKSEVQRAPY